MFITVVLAVVVVLAAAALLGTAVVYRRHRKISRYGCFARVPDQSVTRGAACPVCGEGDGKECPTPTLLSLFVAPSHTHQRHAGRDSDPRSGNG